MDTSQISKFILIIVIVVLLGNAVAISRDYQDSWILEGLEIPFTLFVITYAVAFFSERRTTWMVILAIIGRTVFLLIPNLKYVWFQGPYIDQQVQYALANHVYKEGYISTASALHFSHYTAAPLTHLLFSIFSMILNIPLVDSMKYLPVLFSPMYPLLTSIVVKKTGFSQKTAIFKFALFISSVPFTTEQYIVTGTLFGILLAFLILSNLVSIFQKNDRHYWLLCIIFIFALAVAHSVTSVILTSFLLVIMALQRISYFKPKLYLRASTVIAAASICAAWLMFPASSTLQEISGQIFVAVLTGTTPKSEYVPSTFFELVHADMLAAIKTFLVYYGADVFLLLLTLIGLVILWRIRKQSNDAAKFFFLFGGLALVLMLIAVPMKLGATRILHFERLLFPFFSGMAVFYITKKRLWIRPIAFSLMMLLAIFELYGCQPLIPSANILYPDLPISEPVGYINQVNSIYQRHAIKFVYNHVVGRIASDSITRNQIIGLTDTNFSTTHLIYYYPLDNGQPKQEYDFLVIHIPGKSGILEEKANIRTPSLILETIHNSSIVYTNGESYILVNSYIKP